MKELNKWVDVRKKQVREVTDMDITIKNYKIKYIYNIKRSKSSRTTI